MAFQKSVAVRNAALDAEEVAIGTAPIIEIFTGAQPANCAAADSGTKIASGTLPSDWMAAAASGVKAKLGTWTITGLPAAGTGTTAGHFRIKDSTGTTCHYQGDITATGGGGVMTLDNTSVANNQGLTVNSFNITGGNA